MNYNVACVIVSFNRLEKLKACVRAVKEQSLRANEIIIIDQSTEEEVLEWLKGQDNLSVFKQENSGGAGGFYTGVQRAHKKGYEWIWCMDDDTLPDKLCLEKLFSALNNIDNNKIGFLSSKVTWIDGSPHKMNLPGYFYKNMKWEFIGEEKFNSGVHKIDCASFVSILISRKAVEAVGLPDKDFFVWYDDLEYTARIKDFNNYYVADSTVMHDTSSNSPSTNGSYDRKYFIGIRNFCFFYRDKNKTYLLKTLAGLLKNVLLKILWGKISIKKLFSFFRAVFMGLTGNLKNKIS